MDRILEVVHHRPWPLPRRPWVTTQAWNHLLFLHYALPISAVRPLVPPRLPLDTYDRQAWVSVTPFHLTDLRLRFLPTVPGASEFAELNVRTYTTLDGKPGVFFFSLDAASLAAVLGARAWYRLPYFWARMRVAVSDAHVSYRSRRRSGPRAEFQGHYTPTGPARPARPGELDYFLVERYCLYTVSSGRVYRADIHHVPWPLQSAEVELRLNTMVAAAGIEPSLPQPVAHYARRIEVLTWPPERCH